MVVLAAIFGFVDCLPTRIRPAPNSRSGSRPLLDDLSYSGGYASYELRQLKREGVITRATPTTRATKLAGFAPPICTSDHHASQASLALASPWSGVGRPAFPQDMSLPGAAQ